MNWTETKIPLLKEALKHEELSQMSTFFIPSWLSEDVPTVCPRLKLISGCWWLSGLTLFKNINTSIDLGVFNDYYKLQDKVFKLLIEFYNDVNGKAKIETSILLITLLGAKKNFFLSIDGQDKSVKVYKSLNKTYLMKDNNTGLYKIGKSKNPKHREKTLQSEKPTIKMVKVFDKDIEKKLHAIYNDQRVRGEWFDLTPIQVKYICTHY
jgi:hypothetical protein